MESERLEAQAALASVQEQRRRVADRLVTPWWYHPILGILLGGLVAAQASGSFVLRCFAAAAVAAGAVALLTIYKRLTGLWASGVRGAAGRATATLLAVALAGYGVALAFGGTVALSAGAFVAVAAVPLGRRVDAALRRDLRR